MRKLIVAIFVTALLVPATAAAQHVKTNSAKPNPIREYGKYRPNPGPKTYRFVGGAHRAQ
jgi:hypothetical protein